MCVDNLIKMIYPVYMVNYDQHLYTPIGGHIMTKSTDGDVHVAMGLLKKEVPFLVKGSKKNGFTIAGAKATRVNLREIMRLVQNYDTDAYVNAVLLDNKVIVMQKGSVSVTLKGNAAIAAARCGEEVLLAGWNIYALSEGE